MKTPKRIGLSLFDDELKSLINASAKIFPITQEQVDTNVNPNNYEYGRIERSIYRWNGVIWEYIVADDVEIKWSDVQDKPDTFPATSHIHNNDHSHDNKSVIDTVTQILINGWNSAVTHISDVIKHITSEERTLWNTVSGKSNTDHAHINTDIALESMGVEIKELPNGTKDEVRVSGGKAEWIKRVNDEVKINSIISGADLINNRVTRVYNPINYSNLLDGDVRLIDNATVQPLKRVHVNDRDIIANRGCYYVNITDGGIFLITERTVIPTSNHTLTYQLAVPEIYTISLKDFAEKTHTHDYSPSTHNHDTVYYTETEMNTLLNGKSDIGHDHDGRYFTESEVNTLLGGKEDKFINRTVLTKIIEGTLNDTYDLDMLYDLDDRLYMIEGGYTEGHTHSDLTLLESITQLLIDKWNSAVTHVSDAIKHITSEERTLWNTVTGKEAAFTKNTAFNKNFGTTLGTVTQGNDSRLSDARTPLTHQHLSADVTDLSVSWNSLADKPLVFPPDTHNHNDVYYTESEITTLLLGKAESTTLSGHTGSSTIHVTQTDKDNWDGKAKIVVGAVKPTDGSMWYEEIV